MLHANEEEGEEEGREEKEVVTARANLARISAPRNGHRPAVAVFDLREKGGAAIDPAGAPPYS